MTVWQEGYIFEGRPSFINASKLKGLKEDLKEWNKMEFRDAGIKKRNLLDKITRLNRKE